MEQWRESNSITFGTTYTNSSFSPSRGRIWYMYNQWLMPKFLFLQTIKLF